MTQQTYTGGCQCGAIAYEVEADLGQTITCNCSRCRRLGWVLTFAEPSRFRLTKDGPVTDFQFGRKAIHHSFCPTCGIEAYARGTAPDGSEMIAVNVNCLDGVDARALDSKPVDGASF